MPDHFPSYQTCHKRFQQWQKDATIKRVLDEQTKQLYRSAKINVSECFIDGSSSSAKKGANESVRQNAKKGTKIMVVSDRSGLPVAIYMDLASPAECKLVENTVNESLVDLTGAL